MRGSEAGFTLLELMISVSLFAVLMAVIIPSFFELQGPALQVEGMGKAQSQVNGAFETLDHEIRYASTLNSQSALSASGDWYEEFESTYTGSGVCTQLRYVNATGELDQRTWNENPTSNLSAWDPLATGLQTALAASPFTFYPATGIEVRQRLGIALTATSATATQTISAPTSLIFAAVDSSGSSASNDNGSVCQQEPES